jgi:hypothetical protein
MPRFSVSRNERWLIRKRDGLLKRLSQTGPIVNGSIVIMARPCGNTRSCKCSRGEKHVGSYLTYSVKGKTHTLYLPVDLHSQARVWSGRYRLLKKLIREICTIQREIIGNYVQERKRRQGRG